VRRVKNEQVDEICGEEEEEEEEARYFCEPKANERASLVVVVGGVYKGIDPVHSDQF